MKFSNGWYSILLYFVAFYYVPIILMFYFGPHSNFSNEGNAALLITVTTVVLFFTAIFTNLNFSLPISYFSKLPNFFETYFFTLLGIMFFPIAMYFFYQYGMSFRYSGESLSEAGIIPKLVTLYKGLFSAYILYCFIMCCISENISTRMRVTAFIYTVNWILCANGAVDVLWILVGLLISLRGNKSIGYFIICKGNFSVSKFLRKLIGLLGTGIGVFAVIFFGFANKIGFEEAVIVFKDELLTRVVYYMYYRLSVFSSSLEIALSNWANIDFYLAAVSSELELFGFRVGTILGFDVERPAVEGLNRFNYLNLFSRPSLPDAGATPGPIGSFASLPFLPFNLIFCAIYLSLIVNTYTKVLVIGQMNRFNFFSLLFFVVVNYVFLHNPFSSFLKIGPELFRTILFMYALGCVYKVTKTKGYSNA